MTRNAFRIAAALAAAGLAASGAANAQTRVTYKSAKSGTSYYQMAAQIAEAVKSGTGGSVVVTVEESQGSVQNVKEAATRPGAYVFTTPPALIRQALAGEKAFAPKDPAFERVRSLFPLPSLTMHYVVRAEAGVNGFDDLAGKTFVIGKGSFGATAAAALFKKLGLEGKVKLANVELNAAVPALQNGQIDGFATAGSFPAPNVLEAAATTRIRLLSMNDAQLAAAGGQRLVIPAGTYAGVGADTVTSSLPVAAYGTLAMDEETAYRLTKAFWTGEGIDGQDRSVVVRVTPELLGTMAAPLHPGAARYYREAGVTVPATLN